MLGKTYTLSRSGINCELIRIETDIKNGLPTINITGSLSKEAKEARDRIRPAITNCGYKFPMKRITINLSPAEIQKNGSHYDLAIASSILSSTEQIFLEGDEIFFGELSLNGDVRWVRGILPMIFDAEKRGFKKIFIPKDNLEDIKHINNNNIFILENLAQLKDLKNFRNKNFFMNNLESENSDNNYENNFNYFYQKQSNKIENKKEINNNKTTNIKIQTDIHNINSSTIQDSISDSSITDIKGQPFLIEAIILSISGFHHLLVLGPPGSGKTMSLSKMGSLMPDLSEEEIYEINMIHSVFNDSMENNKWIKERPFRSPNSNISIRGLIGGGPKVVPGEVSLAHNGILFLDEFLDFHSDALQILKTIIEKKEVFLSMRNGSARYPANFLLVAASNPCQCGYYDSNVKKCICNEQSVKSYQKDLFSPLTDRFDIQIKVDTINYKDLNLSISEYRTMEDIKYKIEEIRRIQIERFENENFKYNSEIPPNKIKTYCKLSTDSEELLETILEKNQISARAINKIIKLSRTIADMNCNDKIEYMDILDAINFRYLDFKDISMLEIMSEFEPICDF